MEWNAQDPKTVILPAPSLPIMFSYSAMMDAIDAAIADTMITVKGLKRMC